VGFTVGQSKGGCLGDVTAAEVLEMVPEPLTGVLSTKELAATLDWAL
jgi:hypothetical protein